MRSPLCDLLGLQVPIIQAPIGNMAGPPLATAVSNAGGLGMLAMAGHDRESATEAIRKTQALTNRPFAVNFLLSYETEGALSASLDAGVGLISLFWGDPGPYVKRVHENGARLMVSVGSLDEAKRAADAGADIIVAQGWEAGGHVRGETALMALLPRVVDEVAPLPVVAAGAISDGRGLAAVLALGAEAAWVGTRFLAAEEAQTHPVYRDLVLASEAGDTYHSKLYDGDWPDAPARTLRNSTITAWEAAGRPEPGKRPGEGQIVAEVGDRSVPRYSASEPNPAMQGDIEAMALYAGQGVGLVRRVQPVSEIMAEMVTEAQTRLAHLSRL